MKLDLDGTVINYEVAGQGPPLLLLHGWGGRIGSMQPVANALLDLRTCYMVDFPGFGESAPPPEPWSITEYADCLVSFMVKAGIEKADVMAHSFGGAWRSCLLRNTRNWLVKSSSPAARGSSPIGIQNTISGCML